MAKIQVVECDDYYWLYIDDSLILDGHQLSAATLLAALTGMLVETVEYYGLFDEAGENHLEEKGFHYRKFSQIPSEIFDNN